MCYAHAQNRANKDISSVSLPLSGSSFPLSAASRSFAGNELNSYLIYAASQTEATQSSLGQPNLASWKNNSSETETPEAASVVVVIAMVVIIIIKQQPYRVLQSHELFHWLIAY